MLQTLGSTLRNMGMCELVCPPGVLSLWSVFVIINMPCVNIKRYISHTLDGDKEEPQSLWNGNVARSVDTTPAWVTKKRGLCFPSLSSLSHFFSLPLPHTNQTCFQRELIWRERERQIERERERHIEREWEREMPDPPSFSLLFPSGVRRRVGPYQSAVGPQSRSEQTLWR